jgi:diguanylate cyclase (GGDEF)-like protein
MIELPRSLRDSRRFLRNLLIACWLGSSALATVLLAGIDLVERHREVLYDAEHVRDVVIAALAAPVSVSARQDMLKAFHSIPSEDQIHGINLSLVIDATGKVIHSSRQAWLGLSITDPLLSRAETNDPDFQALVRCFQRSEPDCVTYASSDFKLRMGSFSVILPIQAPARGLGLSGEQILVVANYDPGVVLVDFSQDVFVLALASLVFIGLIILVIAYVLYTRLLPQIAETSHTDELTRLVNRSLFMERAKVLLADAEERHAEMVFAILDIDHFKRINDTYGHGCGDAALAHVAEIFCTVTRPDDLLCRFGGEEFALLLEGSRQSAGRALERMRLQLEMSRLSFGGHQLKLTASFGAAATAECGYNLDYLYNTADKALYVAKQSGRNRLEWSDGRILSRLAR